MIRPLAVLLVLLTAPALAQSPPAASADKTTAHTLHLPAGPLDFNAEVSTIKLANLAGAVQAEVVTTAFLRKGGDPATRPVTFAINGGPGASSAWLDLGAIGPWRVPFGSPSQSPMPVENAETWLDATDLVFIDPPGTGYSRVTAGDDVRRRLYSVDGDVQALASVVRRWLEANGRLQSPKFMVGESYGGFRMPRLARTLLDEQGIGISGIVLLSPVLDFNGREAAWNPLRYVTTLPGMAAAFRDAHSRQDVADVEAYATGPYLADLLLGEGDAAAVDRMSTRAAALIGLDPALVRRHYGRVPTSTFLKERRPGRVGSPYDATTDVADPFPAATNDNSPDPLLDGMRGPMTSAMLFIYHDWLGWQPDGAPARQYEILNEQVAREWDYGRSLSKPESYTQLRQYLALDPHAFVAVAHGLDDLVTPYFATALLLQQTPPFGPGARLSMLTYPGGHMFYSRDESRAALHRDIVTLLGKSLEAK